MEKKIYKNLFRKFRKKKMIKNFEKNSGRKFSKIGKTPLLRICFGGQKNSGGGFWNYIGFGLMKNKRELYMFYLCRNKR